MTYPWLYSESRTIPGWRWLEMGPVERSAAQAEQVVKVVDLVKANGLPPLGTLEERIVVDEQRGEVRLVAEMTVLGPAPQGHKVGPVR